MNKILEPTEKEVTAFIEALKADEDASLGELFSVAYQDLRGMARGERSHWNGSNTLSTTVLVHEAYLRLFRQSTVEWRNREHFLGVASRAMRFLLIDHARHRQRVRCGGEYVHVSADEALLADDSKVEELLALGAALDHLQQLDPRQARVIECRLFAGLDVKETAEVLDISPATVKRDWNYGRTWLYRMMSDEQPEE